MIIMVIYEPAPAKLNLSLDVLRKRKDGFHDVEMVLTTIDLSDRVELQKLNHDDVKVSIDSRYVPEDERNLAYQAAQDRKSTRLNSSHVAISYAVFCLKKK